MRNVVIFFSLFAFGASAAVRSGSFLIKPKSGVEVVSSNASDYQTILFTHESKTQIGIYKKFEPQSIRTARIRAQEDGADSKSVQFLKSKQGSVFYYKLEDGIKFFSTRGGVLFLVTRTASIVEPTQVTLGAKTQKSTKGKAR